MLSIISSLFPNGKDRKEWLQVRGSEEAFPQASISILKFAAKNGKFTTGWVNKGYTEYKYKKFCPTNILIKVDLTGPKSLQYPDLDMATVEEYFREKLSNTGVSHMVARIARDYGLDIEAYVENRDNAMVELYKMEHDAKAPGTFKYEMNDDPDWDAVEGLFNL